MIDLIRASWTIPQAISFLVFQLSHVPCFATIATIRSETKSWKLTLLGIIYPLILTSIITIIIFQILRVIIWGNKMNQETAKKNIWIRIRRKFVRIFLTQGNCDSSCSSCAVCPWLDKEKYSFDIKRKTNWMFSFLFGKSFKQL